MLVYIVIRSPVLTSLDYFLWGTSSTWSVGKMGSTDCMKGKYEILRKVTNSVFRHAKFCVQNGGGYFAQ
jgi:hypothetical protein